MSFSAALLVIQGADQGQRFELDQSDTGLGRGFGNRIRLSDTEASRFHARVVCRDHQHVLLDLGSSNGTYVNGLPIRERVLAHGDEIQTGRTVLRFLVTEASPGDLAGRVVLGEGAEVQRPDQIVGAAETGDSLAQASQSVTSLQVLYRIAEEAMRPATSLDTLLGRILELALEATRADRGCVLLRPVGGGPLRPAAFVDRREANPTPGTMPVSRSIVDHVLKSRQGVRTSDALRDSRFAAAESVLTAGIREAICVPMQGRHDLQGVLYLDITTPPDRVVLEGRPAPRLTEDLLRLMVAVGRQAALAVEDHHYQQALVKSERLAAVGQTTAILSHHIKNILQGIRGGSYLIDMGLNRHEEELVRKGWGIVERNQERIYQLVLDLLTLAKERQPQLLRGSLNATVAEVCELLQPQAEELGITLAWRPQPNLPEMLFDPEAIHRAVLNLVGNALDAVRDTSGARVNVATWLEPQGGLVGIAVEDNGPGIPAELLPQLFNLFESTKGARGTGIGLAVCQKIAREHGGDIVARNLPQGGAQLVLEWPLISDDPTAPERKTTV